MKALNVIPKVESIWHCSTDAEDLAIIKINGNYVEWSDGSTSILEDGYLDETFTFKPANDLEWLAVNCREWDDNCDRLFKEGNRAYFCHSGIALRGDYLYKQQWQDKRDELYGIAEELAEDKPVKVSVITEYIKCAADVEVDISTDYYTREGIDKHTLIDTVSDLRRYRHRLYCKVERPITWQEALTDLQKHRDTFTVKPSGVLINEFIPAGSFIEICRLVTSLTKGE